MEGAREYAPLFKTGQYGKLYIVSDSHARGLTFRIQILPEGEQAIPNHGNPCLNQDAITVYGPISENLGWTEEYGWIHDGKWKDDFEKLLVERKDELEKKRLVESDAMFKKEQDDKARVKSLLDNY